MLHGALDDILTDTLYYRLIHTNIKNNKVKLILLGVKYIMLYISKTNTTQQV